MACAAMCTCRVPHCCSSHLHLPSFNSSAVLQSPSPTRQLVCLLCDLLLQWSGTACTGEEAWPQTIANNYICAQSELSSWRFVQA
jgi:hypothetical protein